MEVYKDCYGKEFRFNDHVCMECTLGVPLEKRTGRLVQVRIGCGQFGSDMFFLRLRDGSLLVWENAMIRKVGDKRFEDAFYISNGKTPPEIPEQPAFEGDGTACEYSIRDKYPETGFIIEKPSQPETPGAFSIAIISPKK